MMALSVALSEARVTVPREVGDRQSTPVVTWVPSIGAISTGAAAVMAYMTVTSKSVRGPGWNVVPSALAALRRSSSGAAAVTIQSIGLPVAYSGLLKRGEPKA